MKKALIILLLTGPGFWILVQAHDVGAQGKQEQKQKPPPPQPAPVHTPPPVHQPPPVAATPSLTVRPPAQPSIQPRLPVNPPAQVHKDIPLPSNSQRAATPSPVTQSKKDVAVKSPPKDFPKLPPSGFVDRRPGLVPGSSGRSANIPRPKEDVGKWTHLPHDQGITRARPAPVSIAAIGAA
jgi:hypothetical protein